MHQHSEWRKTFAPQSTNSPAEFWNFLLTNADKRFLHQYYCRELLSAVPQIVERDQKLSRMILTEIKDKQALVYLREAANCYILGLSQAAIALSRAAVEARLRTAASKYLGNNAVAGMKLSQLAKHNVVKRLLAPDGLRRLDIVKQAGDDVLHEKPADSALTLEIVELARAVILELEDEKGRS